MVKVKSCCIRNCQSQRVPVVGTPISFYRFPQDDHGKDRWLYYIGDRLNGKELNERSVVCSLHFPLDSYKKDRNTRCLLKRAVPSIFHHSSNPLPKRKKIRLSEAEMITLSSTKDNSQLDSNDKLIESAEFDRPDYVLIKSSDHTLQRVESDSSPCRTPSPPPCDPLREHDYVAARSPPCLRLSFRHFCNLCSWRSKDLSSFNRHMRYHMIRNHVVCSICSERFLTTECLNTHMSTHLSMCEHCETWVPAIQIQFHTKANRSVELECARKNKAAGMKPVYLCVYCQVAYANMESYGMHLTSAMHVIHNRFPTV